MVEFGRTDCLTHTLAEKFLARKWERYGLVFYCASTFMYLVFLCLLVFIIATYPSCMHKDFCKEKNRTMGSYCGDINLANFVNLFG